MNTRGLLGSLLTAVLAVSCTVALAEPAPAGANDFAAGNELLSKGLFDQALDSFKKAAEADAENAEYRQRFAVVRQVVMIRARLAEETDNEKWLSMARGLRNFYHSNDLYSQALELDKAAHAKMNNEQSTMMLAQTHLAMGHSVEAVALIEGLGEKATLESTIILGIALARQGEVDKAKSVAAKCKLDEKSSASAAYDLACLYSLVGDKAEALAKLTKSFEMTLPSRLASFKDYAKTDKDLAGIASSPEFAEALKTKSKMKESSCSGGTSCGKCPNRTKCTGSSGSKDK